MRINSLKLLLPLVIYLTQALYGFNTFSIELPDSIEVSALFVEFKEDNTPLTTGNGTFNSDTENSFSKLDHPLDRDTEAYWLSRFISIDTYLSTLTQGRVNVGFTKYPKQSHSYSLKNEMLNYTRVAKQDNETDAQYDSSRALLYMEFIADVIKAADSSGDSPFNIPHPDNSIKQLILIIHAGASSFADGGIKGSAYGDTPGDFYDWFIVAEDFKFLKDSKTHSKDTSGINVSGNSFDTVTTLMVTSETASQDELTWGVTGNITQQILRSLGFPVAHDISKGNSAMGTFDVMDYAGSHAGNGFFPTLPSAWYKMLLPWTQYITAYPDSSITTYYLKDYITNACSGSPCTEILKIPINNSEYLLIENRQRSSTYNDSAIITTLSNNITHSNSIVIDSLYNFISKTAEGAIHSTNSLDLGIPASGILIWHVNEWLLKETLKNEYINATTGTASSMHFPGIRLIEADGDGAIGQSYSTGLNYGVPTDVFPHINNRGDTVRSLSTKTHAGFKNILGGTHDFSITVHIPNNPFLEIHKSADDTITTFASPLFKVTVNWGQSHILSSSWPLYTPGNSSPSSITFLKSSISDSTLISRSSQYYSQLINRYGEVDTLHSHKYTVDNHVQLTSALSTTTSDSLFAIAQHNEKLMLTAADDSLLYSVTSAGLLIASTISINGSSITHDTLSIPGLFSFYISSNSIIGISSNRLYTISKKPLSLVNSYIIPSPNPEWMAQSISETGDMDSDNQAETIITGSNGGTFLFKSTDASFIQLSGKLFDGNGYYTVQSSDFNRDGVDEAFILGSNGNAAFISTDTSQKETILSNIKRSDSSSAALADLNNDGYVDVIFTGHNTVWALDYKGAPLPGFPFTLSPNRLTNLLGYSTYPAGTINSQPIVFDVTNDSLPEIFIATPDGLLYAINSKGQKLSTPGTDGFEWPVTISAPAYVDSTMSPYGHIAGAADLAENRIDLFASYSNSTTALTFKNALINDNRWLEFKGTSKRNSYFDANTLKTPNIQSYSNSVSAFYLYPNPITTDDISLHIEAHSEVERLHLSFYDIAGYKALTHTVNNLPAGKSPILNIPLNTLGNGVYTVIGHVKFSDGTTVKVRDRIGVSR